MYNIVFFSPTGNTKYLANRLASLLSIDKKNVYPLEFTKYDDLKPTEHLILMHSIHGFNAPRTVKRFVKDLPEGLYKKVSILSIGCNELWLNDGASLDIRKILTKKGYELVVDEVLAMPLTLVLKFPDDVRKKTIEKANQDLIDVSIKIIESQKSNRKVKIKSRFVHTVGKLEDPAARMFGLELHAKKGCISCGVCWNRCPENNIKPNKNKIPKWGFKCSMCMRCIYECPEKVITPYISKFITIKNGYEILNENENEVEEA